MPVFCHADVFSSQNLLIIVSKLSEVTHNLLAEPVKSAFDDVTLLQQRSWSEHGATRAPTLRHTASHRDCATATSVVIVVCDCVRRFFYVPSVAASHVTHTQHTTQYCCSIELLSMLVHCR